MPPRSKELPEARLADGRKPTGSDPVESTRSKSGGGGAFGKHARMPIIAAEQYAEVDTPVLKEFDPSNIKLDATIIAVGKRRTGKSFLFRDLLWHQKDKFPAGIVISQTDELNKYWQKMFPKKYIHKKYQPEIIESIFERQRNILNNPDLTDKEKDKRAPFLIILDDVISDPRLKYDENLMELFVAGRHYRISTWITTQDSKGITPVMRGNTDYAFLLRCVQGRQRESMHEDFGDFLTRDGFKSILDSYTEDNEVLCIDTCPESDVIDPLAMMFWYKAIDPGKFKFGSEAFWETATQVKKDDPPPSEDAEGADMLLSVNDIMPEWTHRFTRS